MSAQLVATKNPGFVALEWPANEIDPVFLAQDQYAALLTGAMNEAQRLGARNPRPVSASSGVERDGQPRVLRFVFAVEPETSIDQPPPTPNDQPAVWDLVVVDIRERDRVGEERYGTRLQPHNGRDVLLDAYAEALDLVVYLRQAVYERDGR